MRMPAMLAVLLSAAAAAAFPIPKGANVGSTELGGTTWTGDGVVNSPTKYHFHADGKMSTTYSGRTYHIGTWKQDGAKIYWECNNRYCEFEGTMDGTTISGKAWNKANLRMDLKFTKDAKTD